MARQQGTPIQVWFVTAVLTALVVSTLIPMAQAGETASTSVTSDDRGEIGVMSILYCQRDSEEFDRCADSTINTFYTSHYNIGWCTNGPCNNIPGETTGTIDMLRTNEAFAWCVNVEDGNFITSCQATFGDTADLLLGNVATFSHPIDGWFDGEMNG